MLGRQSNVILVSGDGHIIDCMRRVDSSMSETRQVQPGLFYRTPLRQDKPVLFDTTPEQRTQVLSAPITAATVDKWLLGLFSGVSPLLCREVCFRALGDASPRLERLDDAQRARLAHELDALVFAVETNNLAPTMLLDGERPKDFSAVPILQYQGALSSRGCGSFSELLDAFYLRRDKAEAMRRRSQELTHQVRTVRDRTAKKLAIQRSDLLRCADREALRQKADLIKANLYRIQKGARTVTVQDYYAEGCPDVTIELDPRKSPQENAAALYKAYRKAKTAEQHLTGLIAESSRNLEYLNSVLDELARAESERDLMDIRAELRATGYLRQPRNAKKEKAAPRAPLAFVSSTGYEILVGRSNTQNDELTHRTARRTDIWLHVQKVHGSHVIIRAHDTTPDEQTIAEAASLAVYYSQARDGGKTPVDYTMARFVRKPSARCRAWCSIPIIRPAWPRAMRRSSSACGCDRRAGAWVNLVFCSTCLCLRPCMLHGCCRSGGGWGKDRCSSIRSCMAASPGSCALRSCRCSRRCRTALTIRTSRCIWLRLRMSSSATGTMCGRSCSTSSYLSRLECCSRCAIAAAAGGRVSGAACC